MTRLALILWLVTSPASAQTLVCMGLDDINAVNAGNNETKVADGAVSSGAIMEIFVNKKTAAWTLVVTFPEPPRACIMMVGDGWELTGITY